MGWRVPSGAIQTLTLTWVSLCMTLRGLEASFSFDYFWHRPLFREPWLGGLPSTKVPPWKGHSAPGSLLKGTGFQDSRDRPKNLCS